MFWIGKGLEDKNTDRKEKNNARKKDRMEINCNRYLTDI